MGQRVTRWRTQCVTYTVKWCLSISQGYELELSYTELRPLQDIKKMFGRKYAGEVTTRAKTRLYEGTLTGERPKKYICVRLFIIDITVKEAYSGGVSLSEKASNFLLHSCKRHQMAGRSQGPIALMRGHLLRAK